MRNIHLFVEDFGHEVFLDALLKRLLKQHKVRIEVTFESSRGGHGAAITELKQYIRDLKRGKKTLPDLIVAATDGNCKGFLVRKQEIDNTTKEFSELVICAVPDPHIERWLLLDSSAFKRVFGKGCTAPAYKCERDLYKRLLDEAITSSGKETYLDGMEYAEEIVNAMNLDQLERTEESLGRLLKDLRQKFQEWQAADDKGQKKLREDEAPYDVSIAVVELLPDNPPA